MKKNRFLFFLMICIPVSLHAYKTKNVVIVVIDGPRYTETFDDTGNKYIPRMWNDLRPKGTLYTRFYNDSVTETFPGHSSIVTGTWQVILNDGIERPHLPTIFEYHRKELKSSAAENYLILGKMNLAILSHSDYDKPNQGYGESYGASVIRPDDPKKWIDTVAWKNIQTVLSNEHPRLVVTNLPQVDYQGHFGSWTGYCNAIRGADSIVNLTWNLLQSDPFYKEQTTLIVTCDHGRHTKDYKEHKGDGCDGCRHLILLMLGPDTRAGAVDSVKYEQIDIAPTVGHLLGFSTTFATGRLIESSCPPLPPSLVFPSDNAVNSERDIQLIWREVRGGDVFNLQVATDTVFSAPLVDISSITDTAKTIGPLAFATTYYWRVKANHAGGESEWSIVRSLTTLPEPPGIPLLMSPSDSAADQPIACTLRWHPSSGASSYDLEVAQDPDFHALIVNQTGMTDTSLLPPGCTNSVRYYWRVKAHGAGGYSGWSAAWSYTTIVAAPAVPAPSSPVDNAIGLSVSPELVWKAADRAQTYDLQVTADTVFSDPVVDLNALTVTSYRPTGLENTSAYRWRVRAVNAGGKSDWSPARQFTTLPDERAIPQPIAPENQSSNVPVSAVFRWHPSPVAQSYSFQAATVADFSNTVINRSGLPDTSISIPNCTNGTVYFWRVNAYTIGGETGWSAVWNFTTIIAAPGAPGLIAPADNVNGQPVTPTLSWDAAARAETYDLQVTASAVFSDLLVDTGELTICKQAVNRLDYNTTYWWRVRAVNIGGAGPWSTVRRFITMPGSEDIPRLSAPADNAVDQPTDIKHYWHRSLTAVSYRIQISGLPDFSSTKTDTSGLTDTFFMPMPAAYANGATIYWRVNATTPGGTTGWSETGSFTTIVMKPEIPAPAVPDDHAIGQSIAPTLIWSEAARAAAYDLQVDTNQAFFHPVIDAKGLAACSHTVPELDNTTVYHWRVRAMNAGGAGEWSIVHSFVTMPGISDIPQPLSPPDNSGNQPVALTACWRAGSAARSYSIEVSASDDFESTVINQSGLSDTAFVISGLANGTIYYWRISAATDGGITGYSSARSFTTVVAAPKLPPAGCLPENHASGVSINPALVWHRTPDASSYRLQVALDSLFSTMVRDTAGILDTSDHVTMLLNDTHYFWRVNATNAGGTGPWSSPLKFTTISLPPGPPLKVAPRDDCRITADSLLFIWNRAGPHVKQYHFAVATDSALTQVVLDSMVTDTSLLLCHLTNHTVFWWSVQAWNEAGWSTPGTRQRFSTTIPPPPPKVFLLKRFSLSKKEISIACELPVQCEMHLQLFDFRGIRIRDSGRLVMQPGVRNVHVAIRTLPHGNYFFKFRAGEYLKQGKVVFVQ